MYHAKKRALAFLSFVFLLISLCPAASAIEVSPRASLYLLSYGGSLTQGSSKGSIVLDFTVIATRPSDYVGVTQLSIFDADTNDRVDVITGTTANGLLRKSATTQSGDFTYYGTSGVTYYAVLTVYAERDGGSDFRMYTTNNCTAP